MSIIGNIKGLFDGRNGPRDYECRGCGTGFDVQHHVCPVCGSYSVERPNP